MISYFIQYVSPGAIVYPTVSYISQTFHNHLPHILTIIILTLEY